MILVLNLKNYWKMKSIFYEFIDSFNSGSGEGGYFDIDLSFIDRIYDDYNLHFPISKDDFYKLISEDIDLKNVLSVDVDWNRNHTIDYLRENYRVISKKFRNWVKT